MIAHGLRSGVVAVVMPVRTCPACKGCWPAAGCEAAGWRCGGCGALALPDPDEAVRHLRALPPLRTEDS